MCVLWTSMFTFLGNVGWIWHLCALGILGQWNPNYRPTITDKGFDWWVGARVGHDPCENAFVLLIQDAQIWNLVQVFKAFQWQRQQRSAPFWNFDTVYYNRFRQVNVCVPPAATAIRPRFVVEQLLSSHRLSPWMSSSAQGRLTMRALVGGAVMAAQLCLANNEVACKV